MVKILVACSLPEAQLAALRSLGSELTVRPDLTCEALPEALRDVAILIVDRLRVPPDAVRAAEALQMIVRVGADVSNIAVEEASNLGIFVTHCPQCTAASIAELALGLLIGLDRGAFEQVCAVRGGSVPRAPDEPARGLAGMTLGLLGLDAISIALAERARACGMRVLVWSEALLGPHECPPGIELCNARPELARRCEAVFSYAPDAQSAGRRPDAKLLRSLSDGALVVYIGDPEGLDQNELLQQVQTRRLRLAIDAWTGDVGREPPRLRSRLARQPGVVVTRQLAARTRHARRQAACEAVEIVRRFLVHGEVQHCVNLLERSPATWQLLLRLRDTVGVMAAVMDAIRADGVNAEEINTRVFTGARAAWCTIALDERPSMQALDAIRQIDGVLHLELRAVV